MTTEELPKRSTASPLASNQEVKQHKIDRKRLDEEYKSHLEQMRGSIVACNSETHSEGHCSGIWIKPKFSRLSWMN